jgi:hypothetical protein
LANCSNSAARSCELYRFLPIAFLPVRSLIALGLAIWGWSGAYPPTASWRSTITSWKTASAPSPWAVRITSLQATTKQLSALPSSTPSWLPAKPARSTPWPTWQTCSTNCPHEPSTISTTCYPGTGSLITPSNNCTRCSW